MKEGITAAIGLQAPPQIIPAIDGMHRLVLYDFFEQEG